MGTHFPENSTCGSVHGNLLLGLPSMGAEARAAIEGARLRRSRHRECGALDFPRQFSDQFCMQFTTVTKDNSDREKQP